MNPTKVVNLLGEVNNEMYTKVLRAVTRTDSDPLTLIFNTEGGDEVIGLAVFDLIKQYDGEVTGIAVGRCHSAGTLPFLACDIRRCTENAEFLFHLGSGSYDNTEELKRTLRVDRLWNALIAEATGKPLTTVIKWHRRETYFDAKQALANGITQLIIERSNK